MQHIVSFNRGSRRLFAARHFASISHTGFSLSAPHSPPPSTLRLPATVTPVVQTQTTSRHLGRFTMPLSNGSRTILAEHDDKIRMLVLETDEQHPDDHRESGTFGDVLDSLFKQAGREHDPPLGTETVIRFVVEEKGGSVPSASDIKDIHAILITGSMYDAHGDNPWIIKLMHLIQTLWQDRPDIRFSGVCFGHQILCRALGAKVDSTPDEKWELAHTPISLTPMGAKLFNNPPDGIVHLHQMHQDHVAYPPSSSTTTLLSEKHDGDIHVWGSSATTEVQGVYIRKRLFTTQGHLGFDEDMVKRQIQLRIESGSIDREEDRAELENAWDTAEAEHDGVVVAGAILRFFHGDDDDEL